MGAFLVCAVCGQTFAEFQKTGLLGCPECYGAFSSELDRVFRRLHGTTRHVHVEAVAVPVETLSNLEAKLKDAVAREAYEEASNLRDRIQKLKARAGHDI